MEEINGLKILSGGNTHPGSGSISNHTSEIEIFSNRGGLLNNLNIFKKDTIFIFHDTYREHEIKLANDVASKLNKKITFHNEEGDFWAMIK
jgi:hypothetical protein